MKKNTRKLLYIVIFSCKWVLDPEMENLLGVAAGREGNGVIVRYGSCWSICLFGWLVGWFGERSFHVPWTEMRKLQVFSSWGFMDMWSYYFLSFVFPLSTVNLYFYGAFLVSNQLRMPLLFYSFIIKCFYLSHALSNPSSYLFLCSIFTNDKKSNPIFL